MSNEADTVLLFQTKYRGKQWDAGDDDPDSEGATRPSPPVILPSGWGKRLKKPGPVYTYTVEERLIYNEIQYIHGPEQAKAWADRRWNERDTK